MNDADPGSPAATSSPAASTPAASTPTASTNRRLAWAAGLLAAGAVGGGLIALSVPAAAENIAGTGTGAQVAATADPSKGPGGRGGPRAGETPLTGADADKAKAAALAAVPGATIVRVETDADGHAKYEAHMTKADGTPVTVYVDADFNVVSVESR
jgi:hypothetical protein